MPLASAFGVTVNCHVQQLSGDRLSAVVDNELLHAGPSIQRGDMLSLDERHVLESVGPSEARAFHEMVKALGEDEAAVRWRQSRIDCTGLQRPGMRRSWCCRPERDAANFPPKFDLIHAQM